VPPNLTTHSLASYSLLFFSVEMKLELWCFLWKSRSLKITSPLKSGPYGAQPLISPTFPFFKGDEIPLGLKSITPLLNSKILLRVRL
jgi:hypothetical protein